MTISKDLFLAILALDSYNRGYGAGIDGLSDAEGTAIGAATVKKASSSLSTSEEVAAGFYAIAYEVNGDQVEDMVGKPTVIAPPPICHPRTCLPPHLLRGLRGSMPEGAMRVR